MQILCEKDWSTLVYSYCNSYEIAVEELGWGRRLECELSWVGSRGGRFVGYGFGFFTVSKQYEVDFEMLLIFMTTFFTIVNSFYDIFI